MKKLGLKIKSLRNKSSFPIQNCQKVINAFSDDFLEDKYFKSTIYEYTNEQKQELENLLSELF